MTAPAIVGPKQDALNMVALSNRKCGFCNTGSHDRCPGGTRSGTKGVRICPCEETERCGRKRCLKCNNRIVDEIGERWLCADTTACERRIQIKRDADPLHQAINKAKETARMTQATEEKAKREKVVKVGKCLVTGKETKGGLFAPGQDAKYVSLRVADVEAANFTKTAEAAQLKRMKDDGTSEKLQAKFVKAVGLAKGRWETRKAAEAEKAKAKADKAKGKTASADEE